ncbi:DUF1656 domain-containing protein [Citrobacter sp. JGM124]|uniref:DUF1656 domain-containing protein n=1 Tax=Citrobacter sp. JGM124 TaxID=2799789 RepID=UPI001BAC1E35|nr:DUF1656 domain-containing protein [Citrobacter sp. JGM124]MBS0849997.1 DUF1656 domain-containing protein [Citrobacter sp. JGM124]
MIADINLGGVLLPGLLVIALVAFFCTLVVIKIVSSTSFYAALPCGALIEFATFIAIFTLLIPGMNLLGWYL